MENTLPGKADIARGIRAWRQERGMTQVELAGVMGVTQSAISQMESGGKNLKLDTAVRLAEALRVSINLIAAGRGPEEAS